MTPQLDERESWSEYRRLVMAGLKDLKEEMESLNQKLDAVKIDIITLKVKASILGAIGGTVVSLAVTFIWKAITTK